MDNNFSHFLITGANGFIGRRLSEYLKNLGCKITAVLRSSPNNVPYNLWDQIIIHDFNQNDNFAKHLPNIINKNIDAVIHLANIAHTNNPSFSFSDYWKTNVISTLDLLDFSVLAKAKSFLYLSSIKAVATPKDSVCRDESYNVWPDNQDFYGITKRTAEELLQRSYHPNLQVSILRPSLVYGPNLKGHLELLIKAQQLLPNLPDINNQRSMVHIDDLIQAILLAIKNPKANQKIFIVTDNMQYSTRQICDHIKKQISSNTFLSKITIPYFILNIMAKCGDLCQLMLAKRLGHKFYFNSQMLDKLFGSSCFDATQIKNTLNWEPKHTFFDEKI